MVKLLDSTLREGEQMQAVSFSTDAKLAIARQLDALGVDLIEAGNLAVDPAIAHMLIRLAKAGLRAKIGVYCPCRIEDVQQALSCGIDFLNISLSVAPHRIKRNNHPTIETAVEEIAKVIGYARTQRSSLLIRYTAEDTIRSPLEHVTLAAIAAVEAGANFIGIADTAGYATPFHPNRSIARYVTALKQSLADRNLTAPIAVHCHNDRGLALANALDAYYAGAEMMDVSVMGLGKRSGIVDLAELLINLMDVESGFQWRLGVLPELYELVSLQTQIPLLPHHPVVGENAFNCPSGANVNSSRWLRQVLKFTTEM